MAEPTDRLWAAVAFLSVGVGFAIGAIFVLMFRRGREQAFPSTQFAGYLGQGELYQSSRDGGGGYKRPKIPDQPLAMPSTLIRRSASRTVTAGTDPVKVLTAWGDKPWHVQVRVVAPNGGQAIFSSGSNPAEGVSHVQGDFPQDIYLSPGEDLYVAAQVGTVTITASGGEAV